MISDKFTVKVMAADGEALVTYGGEKYHITLADLKRIGVTEGAEGDCDAISALEQAAEKLACIKKAFVYLSYRGLSTRMLGRKLARAGFSETAVEEATVLLTDRGYLDDMALCKEYAASLQRTKKYGAMRIKKELFTKGFDRDTIDAAVEDLEETPEEVVLEILRKKFPHLNPEDRQARSKAVAYLASRGYDYDDINNAISAMERE